MIRHWHGPGTVNDKRDGSDEGWAMNSVLSEWKVHSPKSSTNEKL